jgi:acyl transferase domain-containing protein
VWLEIGPGHTLSHLVRGAAPLVTTVATLDGDDAGASLAQAIGATWAAGIAPDWPAVHAPVPPRRVPLPTYPFQRQRYWLERMAPGDTEPDLVKREDVASWLYLPCWKQTPPPVAAPPTGPCVLVVPDDRFGQRLEAELTARRLRVVRIDARRGAAHDYGGLLREALRDAAGAHVVHAASVRPSGRADGALDDGVFGVHALVSALARLDRLDVHLTVVTGGAHNVRGDEEIDPRAAMLRGLCAVVPLEHPRITTTLVDVDRHGGDAPAAIARLADEILARPAAPVVAHRAGRRWVRTFEPVPPRPVPARRLVAGATYLITGGTGRIGLALARHITTQADARVILASRHATRHDPAALGLAADRVRLIDADVADEHGFRAALAAAEAGLGPVRGAIHAAAATAAGDFPLLLHLEPEVWSRHLRAKMDGTRVLARVLGDRPLDFCVLMSSISSHLGGGGFGAYAAANAFMDGFAEQRAAAGDTAWISAGWDGWRFDAASAAGSTAELAMTAIEGLAAFAALLGSCDGGSVVISTADLPRRVAAVGARAAAPPDDNAAPRFPRPSVSSDFAEPASEVERRIASAWQAALGIDRVGRHDNFVELGGHSLLGVQLMASLSGALGVRLTQRDLWDTPTVAGLAAKVDAAGDGALHENVDRQVLDALETIHNLSDEEIERLLSE